MKKSILICVVCLFGFTAFAQEEERFTEEKASDWVKVTIPVTAVTPRAPARTNTARSTSTRTTRRTTTAPAQPPANPKENGSFSTTNEKIKRFKKKSN